MKVSYERDGVEHDRKVAIWGTPYLQGNESISQLPRGFANLDAVIFTFESDDRDSFTFVVSLANEINEAYPDCDKSFVCLRSACHWTPNEQQIGMAEIMNAADAVGGAAVHLIQIAYDDSIDQ